MRNNFISTSKVKRRSALLGALLFFFPGPAPCAQSEKSGPVPATSAAGLFERVIENQKRNETALDEFERLERVEIRKTAGELRPLSIKVSRVIPSGTGMAHLTMGPDGRPLGGPLYRAALEQLERSIALVVTQASSQRAGLERYAKKKRDRDDLIEATRQAFLFTRIGEELRGGSRLVKYAMAPNPGFRPTSRFTTIYPKVRGFVWVDPESEQLARIEGDVTEEITVGLFLAKVYKGSHFMQERYEYSPGLWLPSFSQYDFDGRKFFSGFSIHERTFYSDYKRLGPPAAILGAIRAELARLPPASAPDSKDRSPR